MKTKFLTILSIFICNFSVFSQPSNLLSPKAKVEFNKENYEPCIAEMTKLIQLKPNDDAAYVERGRCLFYSANGSKAYDQIRERKAKTIFNEDKLIEATNNEFDSRRLKAIADASKAIELNPKNATAYNLRGYIKSKIVAIEDDAKAKRFSEVIADYNQALKIDPKLVKAYINRGSELYSNSKHEEALADFKKALELEPKNDLATQLLSTTLKRIEESSTRIKDCLKSAYPYNCVSILKAYADAHPKSAKAFLDLARANNSVEVYYNVENKEEYWKNAEAAYLKTIELNPMEIDAYTELYNFYKEKIRNKANAKIVANKVVEKIPSDPKSYILRGRAAQSDQNWSAAITDFTHAIELNSKFSSAYEHRSNAFAGLKQFDKALADLNKAIELDPNNGAAYFARGNFFTFQNKNIEAIADYTNADKLNITCAKTKRAVVYTKIAMGNKELGNSENFKKAQQDFLADDAQKCFETNNQYGKMLAAQGSFHEAVVQFDKAFLTYKKFGLNTSEIEKFQAFLEAKNSSINSPNSTQVTDPNITKILNKLKESPVQNGAELVSTGSTDFNTISILDLYRYPKKGEIYFFAAVSENDPSLIVNLKTYDSGTNAYKSTYDNTKVDNYSVVIVTVNVVREMLTLTFEANGNGKIHWILYRKK